MSRFLRLNSLCALLILSACSGGGGGGGGKPDPTVTVSGPIKVSLVNGQAVYSTKTIALKIDDAEFSRVKTYLEPKELTACSTDSNLYSEQNVQDSVVVLDLSAYSDGPVSICMLGYNRSLQAWQDSKRPTLIQIHIDRQAPVGPQVVGLPGAYTKERSFDLQVQSQDSDFVGYQYTLQAMQSPEDVCQVELGEKFVEKGEPIRFLPEKELDGRTFLLCVHGRDRVGNWTPAQSHQWVWDMTPPVLQLRESAKVALIAGIAEFKVDQPKQYSGFFIKWAQNDQDCKSNEAYEALVADQTGSILYKFTARTGVLKACLGGVDLAGNRQELRTIEAITLDLDQSKVRVELDAGVPRIFRSESLDVKVTGTNLKSYKYALTGERDDCSLAGYSAPFAVAESANLQFAAEGRYKLCLVGADAQDGWQDVKDSRFYLLTVDRTAPIPKLIKEGLPGLTNQTDFTFEVETNADASEYFTSLVAGRQCPTRFDAYKSVGLAEKSLPIDASAQSDGEISLCLLARDLAGNQTALESATSHTWTLRRRVIAGEIAVVFEKSAGKKLSTFPIRTNQKQPNFSVSSKQYNAFEFAVQAGLTTCQVQAWNAILEGRFALDLRAAAEGSQTLCVRGQDAAGNWTAPQAAEIILDWTPPTPQFVIAGLPASPSRLDDISIPLVAKEGTETLAFRYQLVEGSSCQAKVSYADAENPLKMNVKEHKDGAVLTVCVLAVDEAGNITEPGKAISHTWARDITPPESLEVVLKSTEGEIPSTLNHAPDLKVKAVVEYRYALTSEKDANCEQQAFTHGPFKAQDTFQPLLTHDATWTICVIGADAAGNWQLAKDAISVRFTLDTKSPMITIQSRPASPNRDSKYKLELAANDDQKAFRFAVVAGQNCPADFNAYSGEQAGTSVDAIDLPDVQGWLTACVIASDALGNWTALTEAASVSWVRDTIAPAAPSLQNATGTVMTNNARPVFTVLAAAEKDLSNSYELNAGEAACQSANTLLQGSNLALHLNSGEGSYQLCLQTKDAAGNRSAVVAYRIVLDQTAPLAKLENTPKEFITQLKLTDRLLPEDAKAYYFKIEAGETCETAAWVGPIALPADRRAAFDLAAGLQTLCLRAADAAGNIQSEKDATRYTFTVNTQGPVAELGQRPADFVKGELNLTVKSSTQVSFYQAKWGKRPVTVCSSEADWKSFAPVSQSLNLTGLEEGPYVLCLRGKDKSGNIQTEPTGYVFTVDTTPPELTVVDADSQKIWSNRRSMNFKISSAEPLSKLSYSLPTDGTCVDNATWVALDVSAAVTEKTLNLKDLTEGAHRLCVRGEDRAGHASTLASYGWTNDYTAPNSVPKLQGIPEESSNRREIFVNWDKTVDADQLLYKVILNTGSCSSITGYKAINPGDRIALSTIVSEGSTYGLCVLAVDAAGNTQAALSAYFKSWIFDTTPPSIYTYDVPSVTNKGKFSVNFYPTTDFLASVQTFVGPRATTDCTKVDKTLYSETAGTVVVIDITGKPEGLYTLCYKGKDKAGNTSAVRDASWTYDITPVDATAVTVSGLPTKISRAKELNLQVTGPDVSSSTAKVGPEDTTDCASETGYFYLSSSLDLTGVSDGSLKLCLLFFDSAGNRQSLDKAYTYTWEKWTGSYPVEFSESPGTVTGKSKVTFAIRNDKSAFKNYKYMISSTDDSCKNTWSYSAARAIGEKIEYADTSSPGYRYLCILTQDKTDTWQTDSQRFRFTWEYKPELYYSATTKFTGRTKFNKEDLVKLDLEISASSFVPSYYRSGQGLNSSCFVPSYAEYVAKGTPLTYQIKAGETSVRLCVIACDNNFSCERTPDTVDITVKKVYSGNYSMSDMPSGGVNPLDTIKVTGGYNFYYDTYSYAVYEKDMVDCSQSKFDSWLKGGDPYTIRINPKYYGPVSVCVRIQDEWGNFGPDNLYRWTRDARRPTVTWTSVPTGKVGASFEVTYTAENVNYVRYAITNGAANLCASATYQDLYSSSGRLTLPTNGAANGLSGLCLLVCNNWKQCQDVSEARFSTFEVDTIPPEGKLEFTKDLAAYTKVTELQLYLKAKPDVARVRYALAFGDTVDCANMSSSSYSEALATAPLIFTLGADGKQNICLLAGDAQANFQDKAQATKFSFIKDTLAPAIGYVKLSGPFADGYLNKAEREGSVFLAVQLPTLTEMNPQSLQYAWSKDFLDCTKITAWSDRIPQTDDPGLVGEGAYKVCAKATDKAGNISYNYSDNFNADYTAPAAVGLTAPKNSMVTDPLFNLEGTLSESGSLLLSYADKAKDFDTQVTKVNPETVDAYNDFKAPILLSNDPAERSITLQAKDWAGNLSPKTNFKFSFTPGQGVQRLTGSVKRLAEKGEYLAVSSGKMVRVYRYNEQVWNQIAELKSPSGDSETFGAGLALTDGYLFISDPFYSVNGSRIGIVYVYSVADNEVTHLSQDILPTIRTGNVRFGMNMGADENLLVIADINDTWPSSLENRLYAYRLNGEGEWEQDGVVRTAASSSLLGEFLDVKKDRILVSSLGTNSIYLYQKATSAWNYNSVGSSWKGVKALAMNESVAAVYSEDQASTSFFKINAWGVSLQQTLKHEVFAGSDAFLFAPEAMAFRGNELIMSNNKIMPEKNRYGFAVRYALNKDGVYEIAQSISYNGLSGDASRHVVYTAYGPVFGSTVSGQLFLSDAEISKQKPRLYQIEKTVPVNQTVSSSTEALVTFDREALDTPKKLAIRLNVVSGVGESLWIVVYHPDGTSRNFSKNTTLITSEELKDFAGKPTAGTWKISLESVWGYSVTISSFDVLTY